MSLDNFASPFAACGKPYFTNTWRRGSRKAAKPQRKPKLKMTTIDCSSSGIRSEKTFHLEGQRKIMSLDVHPLAQVKSVGIESLHTGQQPNVIAILGLRIFDYPVE